MVGGDFNEHHTETEPVEGGATTTSLALTKLGLILATKTPGVPSLPTYNRGRKTLDHIWVCSELHASVTGYGYTPFHSIMTSDHRGVFIHVRMRMLRYSQNTRPDSRKLLSRNPASVVHYMDNLCPSVANHRLREKVDLLMDKETLTEEDIASLQEVDRFYTEMQLSSEAALYQSKTKHEFSDTLHNQNCIRRYWRQILRLSNPRTHMSHSPR